MSETPKTECKDLQSHHLHVCQLKKQGLLEDFSACTDDPGYICHNCNSVANHAEDLCNPSPFFKRP